jgi:hypothetical protein
MQTSPRVNLRLREFTDFGQPLVDGRLYTYSYGTKAHKTAFTDPDGTVPHAYTDDGVGGKYIALDVRGELPAPLYLSAGSYNISLKRSDGSTVWTRRADCIDSSLRSWIGGVTTSLGAALIGLPPASAGASTSTATHTVQNELRETVYIESFLSPELLADAITGAPTLDHTAAWQNAINASAGKELLAKSTHTYRFTDTLTIPSESTINFRDAVIVDNVQGFWSGKNAKRAKPLFFIYGVENVRIENVQYKAVRTRSTLSDSVPTVVFWIGDNRGGIAATRAISVRNIKASDCIGSTMFFCISGNAFDIDVKKVDITGPCAYGVNVEYGRAPSETDKYGMHPYNVCVEQFNGYNNPTSMGFLRVASCYNIKFTNCYGKNVRSFIYAWAGDRGISRVSENVVFENCSHYASPDFLPGVVNYVVQVMAADKDGSTGVALPSWTNYDHLFMFRGCQFQNNKVRSSAALRYYGTQGSTIFDTCIFQGAYYGARLDRTAKVTYIPLSALSFRECVFKQNYQDITMASIVGVLFDHCKFKKSDGVVPPIAMTNGAHNNKLLNCHFSELKTGIAWVSIGGGCNDNEISGCVFEGSGGSGAAPPLELSSRTLGQGNSNRYSAQGLTKADINYYGVQGEPSTMEFDLAGLVGTSVDSKKRTSYLAGTSAVNATIKSIISGNVGDVVVFRSTSTGATVTFVDNDVAAGTETRLLTPAKGNLVKTGSRWTVSAYRTATGWILSEQVLYQQPVVVK